MRTDPGFDRADAFQDGFDDGAEACVDFFDTPPPIVEIPFTSQNEWRVRGNLPAEDVIPAVGRSAQRLLHARSSRRITPKTIKDIRSFDSAARSDSSRRAAAKQNAATVRNRVFYCFDDGDFGFDEPYLQHVYDDIGDFGVVTLIANPFATYVETIQSSPASTTNEDNAVLGADCYTGGFAAAMFNGTLLVDPRPAKPKYQLSPGDLDETIQAFIDYRPRAG